MLGINPSQEQLARIIKEEATEPPNQDAPDNDDKKFSIAYPGGPSQLLIHGVHLIYRSLCGVFSDLMEATTSTDDANGDNNHNHKKRLIPCYIFPCLSFGHGEIARKKIKSLLFITIPLLLLFFFLMQDAGHVIMRNIRLRHALHSGVYTDWNSGEVKDLHYRAFTINEWKNLRRDFLVRLPDTFMDVNGETMHVTMMCPRGILFLFHGCNRYASSFYYSPQGRQMISSALEHGFVTVAVRKEDELGCWNWKKDGETVLKLGKKFLETRYENECKNSKGDTVYPPIFGFGASSGGEFVARLANEMEKNGEKYMPFSFSALNIQIMAPPEELEWNIPTMYTVMEGDQETKSRVEKLVKFFVKNSHSRMMVTTGKKPIAWDHFSRVFEDDPEMSDLRSNLIHTDLVTMGVINRDTNQLLDDPRHSREAIVGISSICEKYNLRARKEMVKAAGEDAMEIKPFGASVRLYRNLNYEELSDADCIWLIEELNVAWDKHEITAEGFENVLGFFLESVLMPSQ